ncbi:MAG: serine/threonine protein kinase [Gammaproteobacteria bacterium]|nr:serine/threonine protein kinase [Gammaproteobacteria bacterium]
MVQPPRSSEDQPADDPDATVVVRPEEGREKRSMPEVPGYDVTDHIGAGGMAHVWLAVDQNLKRRVALKTMSVELSSDPEFVLRFAEEAQIVAGFRHSNIVTVFASGDTADQHYIAMEYISGGTLTDRLVNGPLSTDAALPIVQAMADALAYSHDQGIVHRDFKPGNILFIDDTTPVLSDFGIAKSIETDSGLTVAGAVIGSPRYMAPEQKLGRRITSKVDVYALGLVLFEMLAGTVPPPDISTVRSNKDIDALAELLPDGCEDIVEILADCLREDPDDRPDATEVAERLQALIEPGNVRSKLARILTASGFVVLIGALIFTQLTSSKYQLEFAIAPASASIYVDGQLLGDTSTEVEQGTHQLLVVEPDHYGRAIAVDTDEDAVVAVTLEQLDLPTFEEFTAFNRLFRDDTPLAEVVPEAVGYQPFQRLLALRGHQRRNEPAEMALLVGELNALAAVGDPAAQVILFIANFDEVIDGDRYSGLVQQASNSGYGLATFYQALHYQWAKAEDGALDLSSLQVYRSLMALAQDQGLAFANTFVKQADQLLNAG